jgi:hypothetical protein
VQLQVQQLQRQQAQLTASSSAQPAHRRSVSGNKHRRDPARDSADGDSTEVPTRITIQSGQRGGRRTVTAPAHSRSHPSSRHPSPAPSLADRRNQQPKNGAGGDRHQQQRKKQRRHQGRGKGNGEN